RRLRHSERAHSRPNNPETWASASKRQSTLARHLKDFWYRLSAASKFEFATNLLNIGARAYQILFVIEFSTAKYTGATITKKQLAFLVISLLYFSLCTPCCQRCGSGNGLKRMSGVQDLLVSPFHGLHLELQR